MLRRGKNERLSPNFSSTRRMEGSLCPFSYQDDSSVSTKTKMWWIVFDIVAADRSAAVVEATRYVRRYHYLCWKKSEQRSEQQLEQQMAHNLCILDSRSSDFFLHLL